MLEDRYCSTSLLFLYRIRLESGMPNKDLPHRETIGVDPLLWSRSCASPAYSHQLIVWSQNSHKSGADVQGILADEDRAVVFGDLASKVNATGKTIESPFALILNVSNRRSLASRCWKTPLPSLEPRDHRPGCYWRRASSAHTASQLHAKL